LIKFNLPRLHAPNAARSSPLTSPHVYVPPSHVFTQGKRKEKKEKKEVVPACRPWHV
jgi:hypothetical protein